MNHSAQKIIISFFIIFQLIGVVFMPNLSSFTGKKLEKIYLPYMGALGLGGIWSFFAPEPFSPPTYLDYTLSFKNEVPITGRYPNDQERVFFRSTLNRRVSLSRFIMNDEKHIEFMFMNYLCHKYPGALSAKIWSVRGYQPDYNMVREQGKKISQTIEYKSEFVNEFTCKREMGKEGRVE